MTADRIGSKAALWAGFGALAAAFAVDFHFDTRARDVFSWMDPYQYYEFAVNAVRGREALNGFEIPSIFPFFAMPLVALSPSIPAALWVHFFGMGLLLLGVHRLCLELRIETPSPLVAALVLSSPILIGLARTLYVEFTLTAIGTIVFLLWLRFLASPGWRSGAAFGVAFGLGFMTKSTFPLFMAVPVAGAIVGRLAERRHREAELLLVGTAAPVLVALLVQATVFPLSVGYFLNHLFRLPFMSHHAPLHDLMGPTETWSWPSATYYFRELGRSLLFLLTPLLALAAWSTARGIPRFRWSALASPRAGLWLWLLGPLLLLAAHPLKEPRHAALCVVPAVLLLVLGIEALPKRAARPLLALALVLGAAQFLAVTRGGLETPYFMDRPLHWVEIRERMLGSDPDRFHWRTPPDVRDLHWKYNQNVAIEGFPPNEALAIAWQMFPGVSFDLDTFDDPARFSDRIPFEEFEDLFFLAAINPYNRRCGWRHYQATLTREAVVSNADFVIVNDVDANEARRRFPDHLHVATIERAGGDIQLLRTRGPTRPYRALYARLFLERNPRLAPPKLRAVAEELLIASVLGGDLPGARALTAEFPVLGNPGVVARNIYWIGGYPALLDLTRRELSRAEERAEPGRRTIQVPGDS